MDLLYYNLDRKRMGSAVIINNLDTEQAPTRKDVQSMSSVFRDIGFDVEIFTNLTGKQMNDLKRKFTDESKHKDSNCFILLIIGHGTADNFIQCCEGTKTWNIECLVTEVCDIKQLEGRPKLFFIEACRGQESNLTNVVMTKSGSLPPQMGISLPSKQDVFVGFATVPGFVSFTSLAGSPYLQALATNLKQHHSTMDLSDIHLLVKRQLATTQLAGGNKQGAEERSSLLYKLQFSKYQGTHKGSVVGDKKPNPFITKAFAGDTPNLTTVTRNVQPQTAKRNENTISRDSSLSQSSLLNQRARSEFFSSLSPSSSPIVINSRAKETVSNANKPTILKPRSSALKSHDIENLSRISLHQFPNNKDKSTSSIPCSSLQPLIRKDLSSQLLNFYDPPHKILIKLFTKISVDRF